MELTTSYFGNQKKLRAAGFKICSIARFNPRYATVDVDMKMFAPTAAMLKMSDKDYYIEFEKILQRIDIDFIRSYLRDLEKRGTTKMALCCYEADIDDCHRKKVGEYLAIKMIQDIPEFKAEPVTKNPETKQAKMF